MVTVTVAASTGTTPSGMTRPTSAETSSDAPLTDRGSVSRLVKPPSSSASPATVTTLGWTTIASTSKPGAG
jgi:hypothetical protein